jgi:hypothetical protein
VSKVYTHYDNLKVARDAPLAVIKAVTDRPYGAIPGSA